MNQQLIFKVIELLIGTGVAGSFIAIIKQALDKSVTAFVNGKHSEKEKNNAIRFKDKANSILSYLERSSDIKQSQYRQGAIAMLTEWATKNNIPFASTKTVGMIVDDVIQKHKVNDYPTKEAKDIEAPTEDNRDQVNNSNEQFKPQNTNLSEEDVRKIIREEAGNNG